MSFEPGVEVHGRRIRRHPDVAEITVAEARGNVHAPTQRDREVRKVPAYPCPLLHRLRRRARLSGFGIAEPQAIVDEVADGLYPRPATDDVAELGPGEVRQEIVFAIAAAHQKRQNVRREFRGGKGVCQLLDIVMPPAVADNAFERERQPACARRQPAAHVAVAVDERFDRNRLARLERSFSDHVASSRGMNIHQRHERRRLIEYEFDVKTIANLHIEGPGLAT